MAAWSSDGAGKPRRVSAVVPAYNEAGRVGRVLAVLREVATLAEIVVVDDGSTDGTAAEAEAAARLDPRVRVLRQDGNRGKGQAVLAGWRSTTADVLLLLDADLQGLLPDHIAALLEPVLDGRCDMSLGVFRHGHANTDFAHKVTPWLTGQRTLRAALLGHVALDAAAGYGLETALTVAARRQGWRVEPVAWEGVSHPPCETHRGLLRGAFTRLRMYSHVGRAWLLAARHETAQAAPPRRVVSRGRPPLALAAGLMVGLWCGGSHAYHHARTRLLDRYAVLPGRPIEEAERLLVVAPHPDDEVLGAGGAMQVAVEHGAKVKVVLVTNGDGQLVGPWVATRRVLPSPGAFIATGEERQNETRAALRTLGLPADTAVFLGFPDHRVGVLWRSDWDATRLVRGPFTRARNNPYPETLNPDEAYSGDDLLVNLEQVLREFRPDVILVPHPNDEHPDHAAVSAFTRLAVAVQEEVDPDWRPTLWGYLVHFGSYPLPRGLQPGAELLPPQSLCGPTARWGEVDLTPEQTWRKSVAVRRYTSQMRLMGRFLSSFVRADELFVNLPLPALSATGSLGTDSYVSDEVGSHLVPAGADIVGLEAQRHGDRLRLIARTRGRLVPTCRYRLLARTAEGRQLVLRSVRPNGGSGRSFSAEVTLDDLGGPAALAFAAEVHENVVLVERTGWHVVALAAEPEA